MLSGVAIAGARKLPSGLRPNHLLAKHPRVVNRLAACWNDAAACGVVLDELMVDRRGNRRGFAPRVATELAPLQHFHERTESRYSSFDRTPVDERMEARAALCRA